MQPPSIASLKDYFDHRPVSVLVRIDHVKGSTPRDAGTFMLVSIDLTWGTIGGGQLEYMAIDNARALLAGRGHAAMNIPLGPEIGQCCGGYTALCFLLLSDDVCRKLIEELELESRSDPTIAIFGAGHVGRALVYTLEPLPFNLQIIESRPEALEGFSGTPNTILTPIPEACVASLPACSGVVILTHDHALDFLIAQKALARGDLRYVGMVGSKTKRATFSRWLKRDGGTDKMLERLVLPIGGSAVRDKRPAVIAAMVAAELLATFTPAFSKSSFHV